SHDTLANFDEVVIATGVKPRIPRFPGIDHPKVLSYPQVLRGEVEVGHSVAVIGSGGIGVDTCAYLLEEHNQSVETWASHWGI
ncbi:FAD-dependent oxidoreductase, partial [Acinetobacter baumannii]